MSHINKLLIANRGEIANRIIRTSKNMGIKTVVVYSDKDRDSQYVALADEAYHIGPAPALESYLRSDKIIGIALRSHAQAIHPGFGFLSENASFADECKKNNLKFVGPPADAIRKMGSKSESKIIMTAAKVPVVPGYHGDNQSVDFLLKKVKEIGFPIMIKAVMGGGGKGMRIVRSEGEFLEALESSKRESAKSFKDDRVLMERYIQNSRHIEVQVLGDQYGNYVHLFERDCSIQRRHQKVIEEAPSSLDDALRADIGEKAKAAAKAVNYCNAGTVEFIFDVDSKEFFFMEMNTRLQVEHPITEMITGVDLVEQQLRIAAGERLSLKQETLTKRGHSIEARIYSENPQNNFYPGNGKLEFYKEPTAIEGKVRLESGVREKDEISIYYDPMIAKLVVWGETREEAIRTLDQSLQSYRIIGLPNNINFLRHIVQHKDFQTHDYDTSFIPKNKEELLKLKDQYSYEDIAYAIALKLIQKQSLIKAPPALINFRNGPPLSTIYSIEVSSECYKSKENMDVEVVFRGANAFDLKFKDGRTIVIKRIHSLGNHRYQIVTKDSTDQRECSITEENIHIFDEEGDPIKIVLINDIVEVSRDHAKDHRASSNVITAPMPCTLTKLNVKVGDAVKKGQLLIVTEAMKMEHTIKANKDGVVTEVKYKEGQFIEAGSVILKIE